MMIVMIMSMIIMITTMMVKIRQKEIKIKTGMRKTTEKRNKDQQHTTK